MVAPLRQLTGLAILSFSVVAIAGCQALSIGNPFLPKANVQVTVEPQISVMKLVYNEKSNDFTKTPTESKFQIKHPENDVSPGVSFKWYEIKFYDQNNQEISPNFIGANRKLGTSVYLPRSGSTTGGAATSTPGVSIETSIFNEQLINYGVTNGFLRMANNQMSLNISGWSQDLTGRILFHGQDDNGHEIVSEAKFTLRFDTSIQSDQTGGVK
ncbi:MAG TPA: hypothetical protein DD435_09385 [Cyanobacteria bacterium UBA8530]|nr:hypothetical protein [Cyanobacteria bacterium UBA8530]